jgi:hypothetical protein
VIKDVTLLASVLQTLLTTKADELARTTELVRRQRVLSGANWVQTLVFGWSHNPSASVEALCEWAADHDLFISPQGLDRWFCPQGAQCLQQLASLAVGALVETQPAAVPLLRRFSGVYVEDGTTVALPASLAAEYPGSGGNDPEGRDKAALKIYVRMELTQGQVTDLAFSPGKQPDVCFGQQASSLPAGALRLKDLGFFDTALLQQDTERGVWWINRLPSHVQIQVSEQPAEALAEWLERQTEEYLDVDVVVGKEHPLTRRLMVARCPEEVRQKRLRKLAERARKKGRPVSHRQQVLCGWIVFITNLARKRLTPTEAWVLYRTRWQIELLFKLWKSQGRLAKSLGQRGDRVLCEVLAKLVGVLVQHWLLLLAGPLLGPVAAKKKREVLGRYLQRLASALADLERFTEELLKLQRRLRRLRRRNRRKKNPSTWELLKDPRRAKIALS